MIFLANDISCFSNEIKINKNGKDYLIETDTYYHFAEITPFCLGSVNNPSLVKEFGKLMGKYFATSGYAAATVAVPDLLKSGVYDGNLFGTSPYLVADTVKNLAEGMISSGLMPFLDTRPGYSANVINALMSRKMYLPLIIKDELNNEEINKLKEFQLPLITEKGKVIYLESDIRFPEWKREMADILPKEDIENIVTEILLKSIVLIRKTKNFDDYEIISSSTEISGNKAIFILNNPYVLDVKKYGCVLLLHSNRYSVLEYAGKVAAGLNTAEGRKNW